MDKKALAQRFDISLQTFYNWLDEKPELIKLIEIGLMIEKEIDILESPLKEKKELVHLSNFSGVADLKELGIKKGELADRFNIVPKTLRMWESTKPELIKLINLGLIAEKHLQESEKLLNLAKSIIKS